MFLGDGRVELEPNSVDPYAAWLAKTLTAIAIGHKQSDINVLLPWTYTLQM